MNILITGSTGFVGRHLVPKLAECHQVTELTVSLEDSTALFGNNTQKILVTGNQEKLVEDIKNANPEIVIHLASFLTSEDDYNTMLKLVDANVLFLCRLLDALKIIELKLFINTGTFAEYFKGDGTLQPAYLYAATKTAAHFFIDYYSNVYGFNYITIVPYTIYGGRYTKKKVIDIIYESLNSEKTTDLSPGNQILDFIHVEDVADFYVTVVKEQARIPNKQVFQLGTGKGTSLKELSNIIEQQTGKKCNINWGAKSYRKTDVMYAVADIAPQFNLLNWEPQIILEEGIKKIINQWQ